MGESSARVDHLDDLSSLFTPLFSNDECFSAS